MLLAPICAAQVASPSAAVPAIRRVAANAQSLAIRRAGWCGVRRVPMAWAVALLAVRRAGWCGVRRVPMASTMALPRAQRRVRPGAAAPTAGARLVMWRTRSPQVAASAARKRALVPAPAPARQAFAAAPADSQPAGVWAARARPGHPVRRSSRCPKTHLATLGQPGPRQTVNLTGVRWRRATRRSRAPGQLPRESPARFPRFGPGPCHPVPAHARLHRDGQRAPCCLAGSVLPKPRVALFRAVAGRPTRVRRRCCPRRAVSRGRSAKAAPAPARG